MRYCLVSRVRGTFLGALVGENLFLAKRQKQFQVSQSGEISSRWQTLATLTSESLIELGRFDCRDWLKRQQQAGIILGESPSEVILATLPIALFFHENPLKLRQNLLEAVKVWQDEQLYQDWTLVVGYAIAQSLTQKLAPLTLIPQTVSFLEKTPTKVPQILLKLNNLLEEQVGLERIQTEFSREEKLSHAMAIALYCFLSTLEQFPLSVSRASWVNWLSPFISAITGALSGAYNSTAGIPVRWQLLVCKPKSSQWQRTNLSQVLKLADVLVATWSGVYNPALYQGELQSPAYNVASSTLFLPAIAAPGVIRQR